MMVQGCRMDTIFSIISFVVSWLMEIIGIILIIPFVALITIIVTFILKRLKIVNGSIKSLFDNHKSTGPIIVVVSIFLFWIIVGLIIEATKK
jgi:uncharacterized membrane protein YesL